MLGVHLHLTAGLLQNPSDSVSIAGSRLSSHSPLLSTLTWLSCSGSSGYPLTHHAAPGRLPCRSRPCILGDGHHCFFAEFGYPFLSCFLENISETSGLQIVPSCFLLPTFVLPASPVLSQVSLTLSFNLCVLILAVIFSTLVSGFFFFFTMPF